MKVTGLFLMATALMTFTAGADEVIEKFDPLKECELHGTYRCEGQCKDGFGTFYYYDTTRTDIDPKLPVWQQELDKCYGIFDQSICEPCRLSFKIEGKAVSCVAFYQAINAKNEECHGCLRSQFVGGG